MTRKRHKMSIKVGEVVAVYGVKITIKIFDESSKETLFYDGHQFKGVSINEYIAIRRGFRDVICIIEGEYLDERKFEKEGHKLEYIRKIEAKPIGYFENNDFSEGIKFLPMIKDTAFLLEEDKISKIHGREKGNNFFVGHLLKRDIPIYLPWNKLFNTHIGIFGNTGSGKSNTLAKIYSVLFDMKPKYIKEKSKFVVVDFNGEYTGSQFIDKKHKKVIKLSTESETGENLFPLPEDEFWNTEILSILFKATVNTQKPFLNRMVNRREKYKDTPYSLLQYVKLTFKAVFCASAPKGEMLNLLKAIASYIDATEVSRILDTVAWNSKYKSFYIKGDFFNEDGATYDEIFKEKVDNIKLKGMNVFDELIIRIYLQLTNDLVYGYVQSEHIMPLLKRAESALSDLKKVIQIGNGNHKAIITNISLRECSHDMKKLLPLLIAKHFYSAHKRSVANPVDQTMHLIIDEAHNILSQEFSNEHEIWKDYRLELFEEIIKEGRKFGVFLTIASQRPADISPTIISQVHNFFIHRLVNKKDLDLLENTITTLDYLSRRSIPNLAKGCCIITGSSFDLPLLLQIEQLGKDKRPDSEDVDLDNLWASESHKKD